MCCQSVRKNLSCAIVDAIRANYEIETFARSKSLRLRPVQTATHHAKQTVLGHAHRLQRLYLLVNIGESHVCSDPATRKSDHARAGSQFKHINTAKATEWSNFAF